MNSKKAITLLVLATLLMTLIPITTSQAIALTDVYDEDDGAPGLPTYTGVYGDTLIIVGSDVTAGKLVEVYWDAVDPWDGESGLLNSTKAKSSGAYELWFDIPEALNGAHYLWLRDANSGDTMVVPTPITVDASIKLKPDAGLPGDTITIWGYGYDDEVDVDDITSTLGAITTSPGTPETDELGSWSATFKIPSATAYGDYDVDATDENFNTATDGLTVGPALTANIEEGEVGTVVRLSGRGFADSGTIDFIELSDDDFVTWFDCMLLDEDDDGITSRGTFTTDIVIPGVDALNDDYEIRVEDDLGNEGRVDFEVLGYPGVETDPEYGVQGSTVAVQGVNFTKVADEDVVIYLVPEGGIFGVDEVEVKTLTTERDGTFDGTMKIPAVASGVYEVWAVQEDWLIDNSEDLNNFKVGLMIVILSPDDGPTGEYVSLTASGLTDGGGFQFNISDTVILEDTVEPDGSISMMFTVPVFDAGVYTVSLLDEDSDITLTTEFEITHRAMIETSPLVAPDGYNITIMGWYFSQAPGEESLDFVLYNDTDEWDLDVVYGGAAVELGASTDEDDWDDGYFEGWWEVIELDIGEYTMNCTDGGDIWAQYTFNVVSKIEEIEPRKATFRIGETVSFDVVSTFGQEDSYIEIYTPDGELYWRTDAFAGDDWIKVGTEKVYPAFNQIADGNLMTLQEDAPLGEWSWTWYDAGDNGVPYTSDDEELDSGVFTVEASTESVLGDQVADLNNKLTDLSDQVSDVSSEFDSIRSSIADVQAIAQQAVTASQQVAEAVQTVAQTANQANTAAENAAEAANAAKDAANSLTTLVYGAIGAALVAALAAIVSLMQISRRIAG
jgi:chaperonin cofactor prefoldin